MSNGIGLTTILGCLDVSEKQARLNPADWKAGSSAGRGQIAFLASQLGWRAGLAFFDPETLRSYATTVYEHLLAKMAEWKVRLDNPPCGGPGSVYMLSQLKELLSWKTKGEKVKRAAWPEFRLKDVRFYRYGQDDDKVVVEVETENGDKVYLTRGNSEELQGMDLLAEIEMIEMGMAPTYAEWDGVIVPMVMADIEADLEWIIGMRNSGFAITYAQQKISFGMNEQGFAVREETVMVMEKCVRIVRPDFILSPNGNSFIFWRRREGVGYPVSAYQITRGDFKDPGDLTDIVK